MQSRKLTPKEIVVEDAIQGFQQFGERYSEAASILDVSQMEVATESFKTFVDDAVEIEFLRPLGDVYRKLQKVRLSCPAIVAADVDEAMAIIRNLKEDAPIE